MCFRADVVMRRWKGGAPLPVGQCAGCFLEIWHFFVLAVLICGDVALPHQSRWAVAVGRHCIVLFSVAGSCNPLLLFLPFQENFLSSFQMLNFRFNFHWPRRSRLFCSHAC